MEYQFWRKSGHLPLDDIYVRLATALSLAQNFDSRQQFNEQEFLRLVRDFHDRSSFGLPSRKASALLQHARRLASSDVQITEVTNPRNALREEAHYYLHQSPGGVKGLVLTLGGLSHFTLDPKWERGESISHLGNCE